MVRAMRLPVTKRKKPRPRLAPSYLPHACVLLAVDCARMSGWCIMLDGAYHSSGQVDCMRNHLAAAEITAQVVQLAHEQRRKCVLVFERPFRGTTQGGFSGHWRSAWRASGGRLGRGVYPASWRARILGSGSLKRDAAQEREMRVASIVAPVIGQDEAASVCIALWGVRAGEIGKLLQPAKPRKKAA